MPPPKSTKTLTPQQKDILRRWIAAGAEYQSHWSLIPPKRPALPKVKDESWVRNPIDRFVLAKLEENGLAARPRGRPPHARPPAQPGPDRAAARPRSRRGGSSNDPSPSAYDQLVDPIARLAPMGRAPRPILARRWPDMPTPTDITSTTIEKPGPIATG